MKFMKLKEKVSISPQYYGDKDDLRPSRTFEAGTLINCSADGIVYLDDDGDGFLYFPPNLLEEVEFVKEAIPSGVVWQG